MYQHSLLKTEASLQEQDEDRIQNWSLSQDQILPWVSGDRLAI